MTRLASFTRFVKCVSSRTTSIPSCNCASKNANNAAPVPPTAPAPGICLIVLFNSNSILS